MSTSFEFDTLDSFASGAIGPKGDRVFYLQARQGSTVVSFKCEKQQVAALADYLDQLLEDLAPVEGQGLAVIDELHDPVAPEWVIGSLGVAYSPDDDRFVVMAEELVDDDLDLDDGGVARFSLTRAQTVAFIAQARAVVAAGRSPCPFCGRPPVGDGSWCPCHN